MFDVVVDDGADFDRCSNRGANRNHLLSVVCRGGGYLQVTKQDWIQIACSRGLQMEK